MGNAAAVSNDIKAFIRTFQVFTNLDFHIIKFHLYAVEERIVIGSAGSNFIQSLDHFDDTVQNSFRQYQA